MGDKQLIKVSEYIRNTTWANILKSEFEKEYFKNLEDKISSEYDKYDIFPPKEFIFNAINLVDVDKVKVVILAQDPYHNTGQANGLAFSVNDNIKLPPSLKNIFKELENEYGEAFHSNNIKSGNLAKWANQGVLLLNTILSVRKNTPMSHINIGWEIFTDKILELVSKKNKSVVFMLWGNPARKKKVEILKYSNSNHLILESSHPSPLSAYRGFLGCNHFKLANEYLISNNSEPINWINLI